MKKIHLSVLGFFLICRIDVCAQAVHQDTTAGKIKAVIHQEYTPDANGYVSKKLKLEEINLVSSYYSQDGDHSAITGGIGTQKVTDLSNGIDLKLVWFGNHSNKNTIAASFSIDHHTSASSAYVTNSGLGKTDGTRMYPSLDLTHEDINHGTSFGLGSYYSGEYNYKSWGADLHFSAKTADRNGEFGIKLQAYLDKVALIYPVELISEINIQNAGANPVYISTASGNMVLSTNVGSDPSKPKLPTSPRNTFSSSFSYSQIINQRLQVTLLGDLVTQRGYLSLPFHRVYFSNGKDTLEHLPSSRFKIPIGARINYFFGDRIILRSYYRFYTDDWGSTANTASLEVAYKITPFFSIAPSYRYYSQSASKYFAPYKSHPNTDAYYTSNYEYAKFNSSFYGLNLRVVPPKGLLGLHSLHDLEIRYGHYTQTTELTSNVVSLALGYR